MEEVVYFELNNWFIGRDYPNEEPFVTWIRKDRFSDDAWLKENKLVCVKSFVDMSLNFCVSASRQWVEENCPKLLSEDSISYHVWSMQSMQNVKIDIIVETKKYRDFLRPDVETSNFGYFLPYLEENFGLTIDTGEDYDLWNHEEDKI